MVGLLGMPEELGLNPDAVVSDGGWCWQLREALICDNCGGHLLEQDESWHSRKEIDNMFPLDDDSIVPIIMAILFGLAIVGFVVVIALTLSGYWY